MNQRFHHLGEYFLIFFQASNKQIRGQEEKLRYMAERGCKASAAILAQMEAFRAMYGKNGTEWFPVRTRNFSRWETNLNYHIAQLEIKRLIITCLKSNQKWPPEGDFLGHHGQWRFFSQSAKKVAAGSVFFLGGGGEVRCVTLTFDSQRRWFFFA